MAEMICGAEAFMRVLWVSSRCRAAHYDPLDGPVLVDVSVTQEENVFPFIPAGQSVEELMHCED